jgi:RNA polymerase sigma-70 factor, ECF subfamily
MPESEMTGNLLLFTSREASAAAAAATAAATTTVAASTTTDATEKIADEARLIERARAGDREAFGEIYKRFAPLVHGIILVRVPVDETDDLTQEVFLAAFKNLRSLRDPRAVGAWLATMARRRAAEFYRQSRPTEELSEELPQPDCPRAEASEILTAIRALPDAYRETLILRLAEGMTGPEIAAQTGLTPESVRVNLHRGMKLLRRRLGIEE